MTDLGMLSTDGRCRAFDASGSGYVRGEGICAAILKRRSDAERSGDSIRAIVKATGSNHDGKKNGITLPNSVAQEALIRSTYAKAGLNPADTQYFEAHGTGTAAGDPIETRAIGAVFSPGRDVPLYVGSIKTNIGHLEGASGLAGIIKATLGLEKGLIPPNMHFNNPNPKIDFENWKIAVPTGLVEWNTPSGVARRASINSFGYGGSNAHVILEEYQQDETKLVKRVRAMENGVHARPYLVPLTSHSTKGGELAEESLAAYLKEVGNVSIEDLAFSLSERRTMHQQRSFIVANDTAAALDLLNTPRPSAPWTQSTRTKPRIGFVMTGQGAQWYAMGRQLIEECPHFRQSIKRCDTILKSLPDAPEWTVIDELNKNKDTTLLGQTLYSQTICTALQLALIDLIACWGITADAVVGHSSGEMAAAYVAGILSFENALIAAYYRGRYMSASRDDGVPGGMMAVGLTEAKALEELKPYKGRLTIAAVNSPSTMTLSGDEDALLELKEKFTEKKVFVRQLIVKQAFHSHHMYPLAPAYEKALKDCKTFQTEPAKVRMFSSVTSRLADYENMGPKYWATNMTNAVRFSDALTGVLLNEEDVQNIDILLEIGAHPALKGPSRQVAQSLKLELPYVASLTRGVPDFEGLLTMAGTLFSLGYPVDLITANQNLSLSQDGTLIKTETGAKLEDLPSYAWDHRRYWSETRYIKEHRLRKHRHSLLGHITPGSINKRPRWRNYLRLTEIPWLTEHVVDGKVVFPGAGYISMAIEAAVRVTEVDSVKAISVRDIVIKNALLVPSSDDGVEILLELKPVTLSAKSHSETWYEFAVYSYDENSNCTEHCHGAISVEKGDSPAIESFSPAVDLTAMRKGTTRSVPHTSFYRQLASLGLEYGDKFSLLRGSVESGLGFAIADLDFDPSNLPSERGDETVVHPTLLDAFFHVIFNAIETRLGRPLDEPYVPSFFRSLKISGQFCNWKASKDIRKFQVASFTTLPSARVAINDMIMQNSDGELMMEIQGLEVTSLGREMPEGQGPRTLFYRQTWQPCFDLLSSAKGRSLSEVVDIFAHQYPNSNILHISSSIEKTKQVLFNLGVNKGQRRRFNHLDVWSLNGIQLGEEFGSLSPLANVVEPKPDEYDLVIVSESGSFNAVPFMKDSGCIIYDGAVGSTASDLEAVFSTPVCTAFRKKKAVQSLSNVLAVIIPSTKPSARTTAVLSALQTAYSGPIKQLTFREIAEAGISIPPEDIIVLSSFDESISSEDIFKGVQVLLTADIKKNVIWALEGATIESSQPDLAMIIGLIRSARSENDNMHVVTYDFGTRTPANVIAKNILQILNSDISEDELSERDGVIYIPKVEADDERNRKLRNGPNRDAYLEPLGERRPLALKIGKVGLLETLYFGEDEEITDTELAADEIEIETKASAINFRDIAASMGIIDDYKLGDECAGFVTRVGSAVDSFIVGDRVVAWRPGQGV
jgi:acyl transferase domain-containing protein